MLDLSDLYQCVTYADCGTLSAAADKLHISQPTLTRTMHDVEDAFGIPLTDPEVNVTYHLISSAKSTILQSVSPTFEFRYQK